MVNLEKTWTEIKTVYNNKKIPFQYEEYDEIYEIFGSDCFVVYRTEIKKDGGVDVTDFENNYKSKFNEPIEERSGDGRQLVVSTSRPRIATTYFTSSGDDISGGVIGTGKAFFYDFENSDDIITAPIGFKRKRIDFGFIDSTWVKEGTVYFHNALKGSYVDMFIVCPAGQYYLKNDGTPTLATEDIVVEHYVNRFFIQGSCSMGDELNTESCSSEIPNAYKYRFEVTVPESDNNSNGYINLELYRARTVVLE